MKKLMTLLLVTVCIASSFLGSIVYADGTTTTDGTAAAATTIRQLTLEDAQAMALANNVAYNSQDSYINDAVDSYSDAEDAYDEGQSTTTHSFLQYFNKPVTLETTLQSAANAVNSAKFKKADLKRTSDYNVKVSFIKINKAQYALANAKNSTQLKKVDLDTAKFKCDLGLITKDDLKTYQKAYDDAVQSEDTALKSVQQEMQTLNKYLGRDLTDYNIQPVISLGTINVNDINLDTVRAAYISNKSDLYNLAQAADLAKKKYDLTNDQYDKYVTKLQVENSRDDMEKAYDDATRDYDNARTAFEDATKALDITLSNSYNSLKQAMDNINNTYRDIDDQKTTMQKTKIKYDLGLVSKSDYDKQVIALDTMQNNLNSSIADLNISYAGLMLYVDPAAPAK